MKKNVIIVIVVVLLLLGGVLFFVLSSKKPSQQITPPPPATPTFTVETVATHADPKDCWTLIENKVYAVSDFLNLHPGGAARIIPYCGKDATEAFATQGGRGTHSSVAHQTLAKYYIGNLATTP